MRPKPFLTYFILCAIPLLLLAGLNYWNGIRTANANLNTILQNDLDSFNGAVDEVLEERGRDVLRFSIDPVVQDVLSKKEAEQSRLQASRDLSEYFRSVTLFTNDRRPFAFRLGDGQWTFVNIDPARMPKAEPGVWTSPGNVLFTKSGSTPETVEYSAPVNDGKTGSNLGAVVGVLDLQRVCAAAARGLQSRWTKIVVVGSNGKTIYEPSRSEQPQLDGYQFVYGPIAPLAATAGVARRRSDFASTPHVRGIAGLVLAVLLALLAAFMLDRYVNRRSRGIARVTEDLSAIAKGELDRRIILQSSDDARGLADNINVVTERLRAKIAREEESRQFESFVRLSAMLTHDLKNAIEGLSLTVANMERHFDNPQFRTDALKGLTSATDKLRALVARLARPLTSLSGEHKLPAKVDLVPILQRVIAMTAEPVRGKHTIVTRLPPNLYALVDAARIEEVIENLVLNALEAMDNSGTLTIDAGQTPSGAPTFSVSDTGRGMSKSFISTRLYRPFSTTKKTGIGLGLYTCREVIEASAGSIEVESVEGAGTTFRVVLPSIPHDRRN